MKPKEHWELVYSTRPTTDVSWFQKHATLSLKLITECGVPPSSSIIDVGGGASALVDDLLDRGYDSVTVLDLSSVALAVSKTRLGDRAQQVRWLEADVLEAELPRHGFDVWHDRAAFHFLTDPKERRAYVRAVLDAVKPGGLGA